MTIEEMEERLIEFFGEKDLLVEILLWLDTDTKMKMYDDIMRVYDLDIA